LKVSRDLSYYAAAATWVVMLLVLLAPLFVEKRWGEHVAARTAWVVALGVIVLFGGTYYYVLGVCSREEDDSCGRIILLWPLVALFPIGTAFANAIHRTRN
jgi:hypothetical protein